MSAKFSLVIKLTKACT